MSARISIWRTAWWLLLLALLGVGGGASTLFFLLKFPKEIAILFGVTLGAEALFLTWFALSLHERIQAGIAESRYQHDRLARRSWLAGLITVLGLAAIFFFPPKYMWSKTLALVTLGLIGSFAAVGLLITWLLRAELAGRIAYGFAERWIARITSLSTFAIGSVLLLLFNFLGGIYWWHSQYVTDAKRKKVLQRNQLLRSIQITTISDREGHNLGLFNRTQSDWNQQYNDPKLLAWKISRVVGIAEGRVDEPAWWWRYLPDGESLKCEPFSIEAFLRVPYYLIKQRRKVGGSTPALQAAKNFLDFGQKRQGLGLFSTVSAKLFDEMPRSYIMCQAFSPREMMAIYLATLWAGQGDNYGLHRLALYYFDVEDPRALNWNQAVVAAASLPNPGRMNPWFLENCRKGKCENKRRARVYDVWIKRIQQIKQKLRNAGIQVPKELPVFRNGLGRLKAISSEWQMHDLHIRNWIERMMPPDIKDWKNGARIQLYYDRELTTGKDGQRGLISIAEQGYAPFREQIDDLQLAYTLVDAQTGEIVSQYGGNGHVDMALAQKPVFGSVFKVVTSLVDAYWPDALPLVNRGRSNTNRRRFVYHPWKKSQGHWVRNSHKMPPYVKKDQALAISANIGFVFLSLRWTWMVAPDQWPAIFERGLRHLLEDKKKMHPEDARQMVEKLQKDPVALRKMFVREFGYKSYFQDLREHAIFEAAKAATVKTLLPEATTNQSKVDAEEAQKKKAEEQRKKKRSVEELLAELSPEDMPKPLVPAGARPNVPTAPPAPTEPPVTTTQLASFLDTEPNEIFPASPKIQRVFQEKKKFFEQKFTGPLSLEEIGWNRELRMEIGLRYIAWLAEQIGGFDRKKSGMLPVMTMTLGVNDVDTKQLAAIAAFIAAGKVVKPALLQRVERDKEIHIPGKPALFPSPIPESTVEKVRKRMQGILKKEMEGTASGAGQALIKRYGAQIIEQSGAKTGTVQSSRGVSCIGFVGKFTGAVTLSTPTNDTLKTYRVRTTFTRKKKRLERLNQLWLKRYQRAREGSRLARVALKRASRYEEQARVLDQQIKRYKELGKRYFKLKKQHKEAEKLADLRKKQIKTFNAKRRKAGKRATRAQKKLRLLMQKRRSLRAQQSSLPPVERANAEQREMHKKLHFELAQADEGYKMRLQDYQDAISLQEQWSRKASEARSQIQALQEKAKQAKRDYMRLRPAFIKGHQPWSLSSSKACRILFDLLSEWKDYSERKAKEEALKPDPSRPTPPRPASVDAGNLPAPRVTTDAGPREGAPTPAATERNSRPDAGATQKPDSNSREEDPIILPEIPSLPTDTPEKKAMPQPPVIRSEGPARKAPPRRRPKMRLPEIFAP
ncbi:MAG: transglycosylase domain-containing protein [Myxococcales bacterium]|nr:transglycosylase domain-containing protein [Myxococcales bacterium]MCB9643849.1 transglycosylase domain-containing protein [Myxococcales bacterium]